MVTLLRSTLCCSIRTAPLQLCKKPLIVAINNSVFCSSEKKHSTSIAQRSFRCFSNQPICIQSPLYRHSISEVPKPYSAFKEPKYFTPMAQAVLSHDESRVKDLISRGWKFENEKETSANFGITVGGKWFMCDLKQRANSLDYFDAVTFVLEKHFWNNYKHPMDQVYGVMRNLINFSYDSEFDQKIKEGHYSTVRYLLVNRLVLNTEDRQGSNIKFVNSILKSGTTWKTDSRGLDRRYSPDYVNRMKAISKLLYGDMSMPLNRTWKYQWDKWN